jgi:hypothetical protein
MIVLVIVEPKRREGEPTTSKERRGGFFSLSSHGDVYLSLNFFFFFRGAVGISFVAVWSRKFI